MKLSMVNMVLPLTIQDKHLDPKLSHMDLRIDKSSVCKRRKMSDRNQVERPFHTKGADCSLQDGGKTETKIHISVFFSRYFSKHNIFRYYLLWYKKRSINNSKVTTWISKVVNVMRRTATVRGWFTAVWCRSERQAYTKAHRSGTTEVNWLGLGRSREKSVCSMIVRALVLIAVRTIGWSTV